MAVDYKIKSAIKRAMKTGELLYLDYDNSKGTNTFYFLGLNYLSFNKDETVLNGLSFNYQFEKPLKVSIRLDRIRSARCVEGTRNQIENKLSKLLTVPEISNYFADDVKESHLLDYYVDCIENADDFEFQSTYHIKSLSLDVLQRNGEHIITKKDVNDLLKLLNVSSKKHKEKYKIGFNKLSISNRQREIIPLVYYQVDLNVFEEKILVSEDVESYHIKNIARVLRMPVEEAEQYRDNFDALYKAIDKEVEKNLVEENPILFQLKMDLNLSPFASYKKIKDVIFSKDELCAPLRAFFGKYVSEVKGERKYPSFIDKKVNDRQVLATYSAINEDVTYIQGPPGTGKTTTILNMIASSILNEETCLVTSFTNKAVDNIFNKMKVLKFNGYKIPLPLLRIGSEEYRNTGVAHLREILIYYFNDIRGKFDIEELEEEYKRELRSENEKFIPLEKVLDEVREKQIFTDNITYLERLLEMTKNNDNYRNVAEKTKRSLTSERGKLTRFTKKTLENVVEEMEVDPNVTLKGLMLYSIKLCEKLLKNKEIASLMALPTVEERNKGYYRFYKENDIETILDLFPIVFSTNVSTRAIGEIYPDFDLLIMDEAGQCENAHAIVALSKSKRAVLVGDPSQLLPVVTINDTVNEKLVYEYNVPDVFNYKKTSVLNTMNQVDFVNEIILLRHHYRCKKSIIEFSNQKYYGGMLRIENNTVTNDDCAFIDVDSTFYRGIKNTSMNEVDTISNIIQQTHYQSIGVISPFKNQARLLNKEIDSNEKDVQVGTVHKFQGQERDLVILSLGIGKDSFKGSCDWIRDNKELINVATTRPKEQLIIVGDKKSISELHEGKTSDLLDLINYTERFDSGSVKRMNLSKKHGSSSTKSLYTPSEQLFLDTLENIVSIDHVRLRINAQTDVKQALGIHAGDPLFEDIKMSSFDFALIDQDGRIKIVIEICGPEHYYDQNVIARDKRKLNAARQKGIEIIPVNNRDVRKFSSIRDQLMKVLH